MGNSTFVMHRGEISFEVVQPYSVLQNMLDRYLTILPLIDGFSQCVTRVASLRRSKRFVPYYKITMAGSIKSSIREIRNI